MTGVLRRVKPEPSQPTTIETGPFWSDTQTLVQMGGVTPIISNLVTAELFGVQPGQIARQWAEDIQSPLSPEDNNDLARVAQYYAVHLKDPVEAKRRYVEAIKEYLVGMAEEDGLAEPEEIRRFKVPANRARLTISELARALGYPHYNEPRENPLRLLAELPLPIYLTSSPSQFLERELERTGHKQPESMLFYWHDGLRRIGSIYDRESGYTPSVERPLVYHLFGMDKYPESMVLTEDDYLDYLVRLSSLTYEVKHSTKEFDIPADVVMALTGTALLLLGYRVHDWDFRVLFKGLVKATGDSRSKRAPKSVAMQIELPKDLNKSSEVEAYLNQFFEQSDFRIFWGDMRSCAEQVYQRWKGS